MAVDSSAMVIDTACSGPGVNDTRRASACSDHRPDVENWPAHVDSVEINGTTASGTATFVGDFTFGEEPEGTPGTFEITCAS